MKTKLTIFAVLTAIVGFSQATSSSPTNTPVSNNDYIGWEVGAAIDLQIENRGNEDIDISTSTGDGMYLDNIGSIGIGDFNGTTINPIANINVNIGSTAPSQAGTAVYMDSQNVPHQAVGVKVFTLDGTANYGLLANVNAGNTDNQIGIYGEACSSNGQATAIYGEAPIGPNNLAGNFLGLIYHSTFNFGPSDQNLKIEIQDIEDMNEMLQDIQVMTFEYRTDSLAHLRLQEGNHIGFIAQNIAEVFPELTKVINIQSIPYDTYQFDSDQQYTGVRYEEFIPMLIAAYSERKQLIEENQSRIDALQSQIEELSVILEGI